MTRLDWTGLVVMLLLAGGCRTNTAPKPLATGAALTLHVVSPVSVPGSTPATDPDSGTAIFLVNPAVVTAADVVSIQRSTEANTPSLDVRLTPAGAARLTAATTPGGGQLAVAINGAVVAAPRVVGPLASEFRIAGGEIARDPQFWFESLTAP